MPERVAIAPTARHAARSHAIVRRTLGSWSISPGWGRVTITHRWMRPPMCRSVSLTAMVEPRSASSAVLSSRMLARNRRGSHAPIVSVETRETRARGES